MAINAREVLGDDLTEAHERLRLDRMLGDQTWFVISDALERQWSLTTPVLQAWQKSGKEGKISTYPAASWRPQGADQLLEKDGCAGRRR